jgi:hypothetical protein
VNKGRHSIEMTDQFYAKLGNLYVEDVYISFGDVRFCSDKQDADNYLTGEEIKWLKANVPGIKFVKIKVTVEEIEADEIDELLF